MSSTLTRIEASYFDGRRAIGSPVTVLFGPREISVIGERIGARYARMQLRVAPGIAGAERFVALPDGGQLLCPSHPAVLRLPQEERVEGMVHQLERRWPIALLALALVIASLVLSYLYVLPPAAEWAAERIPPAAERVLGEQTLNWMAKSDWFKPSEIDEPRQRELRHRFADLTRDLPQREDYGLHFRNAPWIGANAFALPGGAIVITDEMIKEAKSDDEILAVLAHEVGHQHLRHTLREILQGSVVAVAVTAITADAASLSVAVTGLPLVAAQTRYSRQFEAEADEFAFALLKRRGISTEAFADLMERLGKGNEEIEREMSFLSTHPVTSERVARARAAAGEQ